MISVLVTGDGEGCSVDFGLATYVLISRWMAAIGIDRTSRGQDCRPK